VAAVLQAPSGAGRGDAHSDPRSRPLSGRPYFCRAALPVIRSPLLRQACRVNQTPGGRPVRSRCRLSREKLVGGKERGEFVVQLIADERAESLDEILLYTLANETRRETPSAPVTSSGPERVLCRLQFLTGDRGNATNY
jgi:hypothetical protein